VPAPAPAPAPAPPPVAAPPPPATSSVELFAVQVGAFRDLARAESVRDSMKARHGTARIVRRETADGVIHRVLVGSEEDEAKAAALAERLKSEGASGFVVRLDDK
jgi:cell division septation protein DedD